MNGYTSEIISTYRFIYSECGRVVCLYVCVCVAYAMSCFVLWVSLLSIAQLENFPNIVTFITATSYTIWLQCVNYYRTISI